MASGTGVIKNVMENQHIAATAHAAVRAGGDASSRGAGHAAARRSSCGNLTSATSAAFKKPTPAPTMNTPA